MNVVRKSLISLIVAHFLCVAMVAQQTATSSSAIVPRVVNFSGRAIDAKGNPVSGIEGITFAIYADQYGGSPLWMETQNVQTDTKGNYTVQLGVTTTQGLPLSLFVSGEARWLGARVDGGEELPRVLLLSVPYALKAADSQTLGGLPPSAFVLAAPVGGTPGSAESAASPGGTGTSPNVGGSGTQNYLPIWTDNNGDLGNSIFYQVGTGSTAKVGVNLKTPLATLDVNGETLIRGILEPVTKGYATPTKGFNSNPLDLEASSYNSSTKAASMQHFEWQAEPTGNNTNAPGATLNLLFGQDNNTPAETGLKLSKVGIFTFAPGQTFPGTGNGTVTSVALSAPSSDFTVSGSPVTTSGTLGLSWKVTPTNADTASAIVKRDANGAFSSGEITANSVGTSTAAVTGTNSVSGIGVLGYATGTSGQGVWGESFGTQFAPNGQGSDGVHGQAHSHDGSGVAGLNSDPTGIGVFGQGTGYYSTGTGFGLYGVGNVGALGEADNGFGYGVEAINTANGGIGLYASGTYAAFFSGIVDVQGEVESTGPDNTVTPGAYLVGSANYASDGIPWNGVVGTGGDNHGNTASGGAGAHFVGGNNFAGGFGGDGLISEPGGGATNGLAGYFIGDVDVAGNLSKASGSFKIDHPLDPANKYLYHSFVESPDMMNIYNGNVVTDGSGVAIVTLPDWFEVLNRDFRYQLTVVGQFAQAIVSKKVANHQFAIMTDKPNVEVSWQVTGIRQDPWANAHRIPVEQDKATRERGFYLHPELYGAPAERNIALARHPELRRKPKSEPNHVARILPSPPKR